MGAPDPSVPFRALLCVCSFGPHQEPMGRALPLSSFWSEDAEAHSAHQTVLVLCPSSALTSDHRA